MSRSRRDRCLGLYYTAVRADRVYQKAIKKHAGRHVTRWTITRGQKSTPAIKRAYDRKVTIDKALHRACMGTRIKR